MKIRHVEQIAWSGGSIESYVILKAGQIENDSIVVLPTLFLLDLAKRGVSQNSIRASAQDLKTFFQTLERFGVTWKELTNNQMSGYLEKILQTEMQLSKRSIDRHISTLRNTYNFAATNGLDIQPKNYTFDYFCKTESKVKSQGTKTKKFNLQNQYLSKRLFEIILGETRSSEGFIRERDELTLLLGYHCGLRTSEITSQNNLQTEKLNELINKADLSKDLSITVPIFGKRSKIRKVLIEPYTTNKIRSFLLGYRSKLPSGYLICSISGEPLSKSHSTRVFQNARDIALPTLKKELNQVTDEAPDQYTISFAAVKTLAFHSLRHTYATNLVDYCYKIGIDPYQYLPEQLGHEDLATTKEYIVFEANIYNRDAVRRKLNTSSEDE